VFPLLVNLCCGDLLQDRVVEGHVDVEGDAVQSLQAEVELVEEQLGFLVQGTDEGVALIKPQQDVQRPLQL